MRTSVARRVLVGGLVGLSFGVLAGLAGANHSLYGLLSQGEINGNGPFNAAFSGASVDGARAFFVTAEPLVTADTDTAEDIYERSGGSTKQVSAGQINGNGSFAASFAQASADGMRVFFTTSEQLVSADTDSALDVYERSGGTTKRVSAGQIKGNGAVNAFFAGGSADGARVFFETSEQLVSGDTDGSTDIYERSGGSTKRVSVGQINGNGAFPAFFAGASADGARVFFQTSERLVSGDTDAAQDLYERSSGSTKLVSAGQINGSGAVAASFVGASADGTRVFFTTTEPLVSGDTDMAQDIYERSGGSTKLVSAGQINGNGAFAADFGGASADGTHVFFLTDERLIGNDNDSVQDVYERSGGTTKRVSVGQINGNGAFAAGFAGGSVDGSRVFFTTSERLVSADTDSAQDIFERSGGSTKRVSAGQINGNGTFDAFFDGASADGTRVFFHTSESLVSADTDGFPDIYERAEGTTSRISPGTRVEIPTFDGTSVDGSVVFFTTGERVVIDDLEDFNDIYGAYLAP